MTNYTGIGCPTDLATPSGVIIRSPQVYHGNVMGVMKMLNIMPRAGVDPTSLALWASVITITPCRFPDVTTIPTPTSPCSSLPQRSVQPTTLAPPGIISLLLLTITYIQTVTSHTYMYVCVYVCTQGSFNDHRAHSLYRILVKATMVVGVIKMGNIVSRVAIEPISLAFQASVLTIIPHRLPDVTTIPMPTLHVAPCLTGGHSSLLQLHNALV